MEGTTYIGFTPTKKQAEILYGILSSSAKHYIVSASRQTGKSMMAMNLCLYWAINTQVPVKILWVSPSWSQSNKVLKELIGAVEPSGFIKRANLSQSEIELQNGSEIIFRSAERYDNIRGNTFDAAIVDEASFIRDEAWNEAIRPTLVVRGKKVVFVSTPKGKNYFYNLYQLGQSPDHPNYKSYTATIYDTPYISPQEIEDAKKTLPELVFKQEYLAEFIDNGGEVFQNLDQHTFHQWPKAQGRVWAGLDLGRQQDATVLTLIDDQGQVIDIYRDQSTEWSKMIDNVVNKCKLYNADLLVEVNGIGDPLTEQISKLYPKTHPFVTSSQSKQDIIEALILDLNENKVTIPSEELFPVLYREMQTFTYEYNPKSRRIRYTHPNGLHDDAVMSLALANYNRRTNYTRGQYVTMGRR